MLTAFRLKTPNHPMIQWAMKKIRTIRAAIPNPTQKPISVSPPWRLRFGIINAANEQLEIASKSCRRWGWGGGGLVLGGLLFEVLIAVIHPKYDFFLERWGSVIADLLVFFGVLAEIWFSGIEHSCDSELTRRSNDELRIATERAGSAIERAAKAELEIAKIKAPRTLTSEDVNSISQELSEFPGQMYDLFLPRMMEPGSFIVTQIIVALTKAGWLLVSAQAPIGRKINSLEALALFEPSKNHEEQKTFIAPDIDVGFSDGCIGICVGFNIGESMFAHLAFIKSLGAAGLGVQLATMSDPKPGIVVPPSTAPAIVHIIIGSKN